MAGALDPNRSAPGRALLELTREEDLGSFDAWRLPRDHNQVTPIEEESTAFVIDVVLRQTQDSIRVARFTVPKIAFEDWWTSVSTTFDTEVPESASDAPVPLIRNSSPADLSASQAILSTLPSREKHTAVWTGSEMIVWGGTPAGVGLRYDPATDVWSALTDVGAPTSREWASAVWTGSEMIVWGGKDSQQQFPSTGGRYNPATDSWSSMATANAPAGRWQHTAVWTGRFMLIWGGPLGRGGGRYDPAADRWARISTTGDPKKVDEASIIWTGQEMIQWGGFRGPDDKHSLNTGARYNPITNTWTPTSTVGAPEGRGEHAAVWTGTEMIIWGGSSDTSGQPGTGGRYNPHTDTWVSVSQAGAPLARHDAYEAWTGTEMIIWGGGPFRNDGARYDPATDEWTPMTNVGAPSGRTFSSAIWTGNLFIVWGGDPTTNQGGRYDPMSDSWTPTSTELTD
jgi:hypothetical protein